MLFDRSIVIGTTRKNYGSRRAANERPALLWLPHQHNCGVFTKLIVSFTADFVTAIILFCDFTPHNFHEK